MPSMKRKRALDAFKTGNDQQLLNFAKELYQTGFFNCFLTPQQFNLLKTILYPNYNNKELEMKLWSDFMKGSLILRFTEDDGDDSNSNENMYMKPGYPTLRNLNATIRYLLYEKAIDYFYTDDKSILTEFRLLEDTLTEAENQITDGNGGSENNDVSSSTTAMYKQNKTNDDDDEDDNYDEDEESDNENDKNKDEDGDVQMEETNDAKKETSSDSNDSTKSLTIDPITKDTILIVSKAELLEKPEYPSVSEITEDEVAVGQMVHPILGTSSAIESTIEKQNELKLMKNFNKLYHSFENDLPNILKKRKLERSDQQLKLLEDADRGETHDIAEDSDSKQVSKLMSLGGAANLSLKNLLKKIDDNRDQLGVTDVELKNLIMDVRKNRSKWANYDRIGQEELYEACEKVVTELRSYTEHSTPFLNKVSKREAPNYYQIIKKPMDLNTVLKKLKTLQYQNKSEFVDDLMLIWQNCLTYNSDPKHFLRVDALAMRKKTLLLIPLIPDIVIRDRAEVEKEAAELELKEKEKEKDKEGSNNENNVVTSGRTSTRGVTQSKSKKGRKGTSSVLIDDDGTVISETTETTSATEQTTDFKATDHAADSSENIQQLGDKNKTANGAINNGDGTEKSVAETNAEEEVNEDEEEDRNDVEENDIEDEKRMTMNIEEINDDTDDLEISTWKMLTSSTRYKLCNQRSSLFKDNKIQPNAEASVRTKTQMYNFSKYLEDENKVVLHRNRKYFDENDDPYLIEYDVTSGVPAIKHQNLDFDKLEDKLLEDMIENGKSLNDLPDTDFKVKLKGSNSLILENISLMQDIRRVCFKINLIRTMQTTQFIHKSQFVAPTYPRIRFDDIDPMSKLGTRDLMTEEVASASLKKSVSALVMLNGFEQTSQSCMSLLTEVAEVYMENLGRSIKQQLESKSINKIPTKGHQPLTCREVFQIVLNYNGIEKPDVIYSYYKEQLFKQNKKLLDLKCGLENFLCDLLRPSMQELSETQFNDDSEQFVNGEFSNEIGDDFFGFKELGLDKEFGMLTSNIPLHLLQSKLSHQFNQMNKSMSKRIYEDFDEVKFPKLMKKDIPSQIGLLLPFYDDLLFKTKIMYGKQLKKYQVQKQNGEPVDENFREVTDEEYLELVEDEDLPQKQRNNRPKVPPNGKITQIKKKFISNTFFVENQDKNDQRLSEILSKLSAPKIEEKPKEEPKEESKVPEDESVITKDNHNANTEAKTQSDEVAALKTSELDDKDNNDDIDVEDNKDIKDDTGKDDEDDKDTTNDTGKAEDEDDDYDKIEEDKDDTVKADVEDVKNL